MIDYTIVQWHSAAHLAELVKAKIAEGWHFAGNLVVVFNSLDGSFNVYRAMIKPRI